MNLIDCYKGETAALSFINIPRYCDILKALVEQIARVSFCLESVRVRGTQDLRIRLSIQEHKSNVCHKDTYAVGQSAC